MMRSSKQSVGVLQCEGNVFEDEKCVSRQAGMQDRGDLGKKIIEDFCSMF